MENVKNTLKKPVKLSVSFRVAVDVSKDIIKAQVNKIAEENNLVNYEVKIGQTSYPSDEHERHDFIENTQTVLITEYCSDCRFEKFTSSDELFITEFCERHKGFKS